MLYPNKSLFPRARNAEKSGTFSTFDDIIFTIQGFLFLSFHLKNGRADKNNERLKSSSIEASAAD